MLPGWCLSASAQRSAWCIRIPSSVSQHSCLPRRVWSNSSLPGPHRRSWRPGPQPVAAVSQTAQQVINGAAKQAGTSPAPPMVITWLGTSSGSPSPRRNVSSILLRHGRNSYLVDCGEGTGNQLLKAGVDPASIRGIFITHLHGDHCFGLLGALHLISDSRQRAGLGLDSPVHVYGPPLVQQLVGSVMKTTGMQLAIPLVVTDWAMSAQEALPRTVVDPVNRASCARQAPDAASSQRAQRHRPAPRGARLTSSLLRGHNIPVVQGLTWTVPCPGGLVVTAAQLQHRLPCWGYVMQEPGAGGRKVVLLGDTCESSAMLDAGYGADIVSHEATFAAGMERKATVAQHSTAAQAGSFARQLGARTLVLTHFSSRYSALQRNTMKLGESEADQEGTIEWLKQQACQHFGSSNVFAAVDGWSLPVASKA